jgi:hypothetical protein
MVAVGVAGADVAVGLSVAVSVGAAVGVDALRLGVAVNGIDMAVTRRTIVSNKAGVADGPAPLLVGNWIGGRVGRAAIVVESATEGAGALVTAVGGFAADALVSVPRTEATTGPVAVGPNSGV